MLLGGGWGAGGPAAGPVDVPTPGTPHPHPPTRCRSPTGKCTQGPVARRARPGWQPGCRPCRPRRRAHRAGPPALSAQKPGWSTFPVAPRAARRLQSVQGGAGKDLGRERSRFYQHQPRVTFPLDPASCSGSGHACTPLPTTPTSPPGTQQAAPLTVPVNEDCGPIHIADVLAVHGGVRP